MPPPTAPLRAFKYTTAGGSRGGQQICLPPLIASFHRQDGRETALSTLPGWTVCWGPRGQMHRHLAVIIPILRPSDSRNERFRFGFDGKNPMNNKNLVFDEVHNMLALPRHVHLLHLHACYSPLPCCWRQVEGELLEGRSHASSLHSPSHSDAFPPVQEPLRRLRKAVANGELIVVGGP